MKCQSLFLGKKARNIIKLLSAEFDQRVVKVKLTVFCIHKKKQNEKILSPHHSLGKLS